MLACRRLLLSLVFALAVAWSGSTEAAENGALGELVGPDTPLRKGDRVSFIGDSITMQGGYVKTIKRAIEQSDATGELKVEVFQRGLNGARVDTILLGKTPWGKQPSFAEILKQDRPTVAAIFLGVNDASQGKINLEQFEAGLTKLVADAKAAGAIVVLATPATWGEKTGERSQGKKLNEYAAVTRRVATAEKVTLCDLRQAFIDHLAEHNTENKPHGILTYDGIHMKDAGNALLAEQFAQSIATALRAARR